MGGQQPARGREIETWKQTGRYTWNGDRKEQRNESSSSFPILGLLTPVTDVTKLNPSIFSKVFLNFFSLLVGILKSFLGSCQHALSNFVCTDM
jgi:hypothetical protein